MPSFYTKTIGEYIEDGANLFNFTYDIYDKNETTKKRIQDMFINHYYFYEIGSETLSIFKFRLRERWQLMLNKYNKLWLANEKEIEVLSSFKIDSSVLTKIKELPISEYDESDYATALQDVVNTSSGKNSSDIDLLTNYLNKVKNIDEQFLNEFNNLFMLIY